MLSIIQAVQITGISQSRLYQLCHAGEIPGAVRVGWTWIIPDEWAEAHRRAEADYSATHMPLTDAARLAGISRQGMLDKVRSGEIKGLSVPMLSRRRWWVDKESLARWIEARKK